MPAAVANEPTSEPDAATIVRLRIAPSRLDPLVLRLRSAAALEASTLTPTSLPPASILCVRSLGDPRPGTLDLNAPQPFSTQRAASVWQRALTARLDELATRAARPLRQPVPLDCEAVLFADRSELLACLARDWLTGQLPMHWWWAHLVRKLDPREALLQSWLESPSVVPQAVAHLAAEGNAVRFVASLSVAEIQRLTTRIVERFALTLFAVIIRFESPSVHPVDTPPMQLPSVTPVFGNDPRLNEMESQPPWHDLVPISAVTLPPPSGLFLGLSLALTFRLAAVRTSAFAAQTRRWQESLDHVASSDAFMSPPMSVLSPTRHLHQDWVRSVETVQPRESALPAVRDSSRVDDVPPSEMVSEKIAEGLLPCSPTSVVDQPQPTADTVSFTPINNEDRRTTSTSPISDAEIEVVTQYGGLFFLINLALRLELYGDFSTPEAPGLDLPLWDFLALVGERLISRDLRKDPVWPLLARLSGHEQEPEVDEGWIEELVADIREKLTFGLGLDNFSDLKRVVFHHPARVLVTPARIDIIFQMDEVFGQENSALPVRVAGLDRDAGWIPAAGYAVFFHFT